MLGVVDAQTLNAKQAADILRKIKPCLKPKAIGVSASYGAQMINRRDYHNLGYGVISGVYKPNLFSGHYPNVYILENSSHPVDAKHLPATEFYLESKTWCNHPQLLEQLSPFSDQQIAPNAYDHPICDMQIGNTGQTSQAWT